MLREPVSYPHLPALPSALRLQDCVHARAPFPTLLLYGDLLPECPPLDFNSLVPFFATVVFVKHMTIYDAHQKGLLWLS